MSNQPKSMHQIRQVLEHLSRGTSINKIAGLLNMSRNTVKDYRDKFLMTGVTFIQLLEHNEIELSLLIRSKPLHRPSMQTKVTERFYIVAALFSIRTSENRCNQAAFMAGISERFSGGISIYALLLFSFSESKARRSGHAHGASSGEKCFR